MKKYIFDGEEMVSVIDIRHAINALRKSVKERYKNFDSDKQAIVQLAYNDIVRELYKEELAEAHSPEEIRAILEMPGDYIVCSVYKNDRGERKVQFFKEFVDGGTPVITFGQFCAMVFTYKSKAEEIAKELGDEWRVIDVSREGIEQMERENEKAQRLLNAIFSDCSEDEE